MIQLIRGCAERINTRNKRGAHRPTSNLQYGSRYRETSQEGGTVDSFVDKLIKNRNGPCLSSQDTQKKFVERCNNFIEESHRIHINMHQAKEDRAYTARMTKINNTMEATDKMKKLLQQLGQDMKHQNTLEQLDRLILCYIEVQNYKCTKALVCNTNNQQMNIFIQ